MGFTSGSTGKAKAFLREQQSWVHSFDCNIHDFHMKEEDSILIAGTLVHSLFIWRNQCIICRANGAYYEEVYSKTSVGQVRNGTYFGHVYSSDNARIFI